MPKQTLALIEHEDRLGVPIVLLDAFDYDTKTFMQLRVRDLPVDAIVVILRWLNDRLPSV